MTFHALGEAPPLLEGELWLPDTGAPWQGVVIGHPHPQRGGSMHNNVVVAIAQGLTDAGIAFLRFNFRGVGRSGGSYGEGIDEKADVLGALAFLAQQPDVDAGRIGLAGYSFGARMSLAAVPDAAQIKALFCVAPPLREPLSVAEAPKCPFHVMLGDRDGNAAQGVERYAACLPDPSCLQVVAGTDHFWQGFEPILQDAAHRFFVESLRTTEAGAST